ncbi:chloride channel protein [Pseudazoarcus pumilus]
MEAVLQRIDANAMNLFRNTSSRYFRHFRRGGLRYAMPWLSLRRWRQRFLLVGAALLAGLICILFAIGAEVAIAAHRELMQRAPWLSLIIAPLGFAFLVWIAHRVIPGTLGSGIPQAVAASITDNRRVREKLLSLRIAIAKVFLTLGALLCGGSVGREGPSVQIGASVLHVLYGRRRKNRIASSRDLIVAGSGAGVAAAFNTPLGGIMFAIEEMCRYRAFQANSTTLTSVIFAGLMSLAVLGSYTYFGRTPTTLDWPGGLWPVLACGAIGGLLGGMFSRILIATSRGLPGAVGRFATSRPVLFAGACGLATAIVGMASGGLTYGTGYDETRDALEGISPLPMYFLLAKMFVIWLVFVSRIPGGIFAPAVAVGAGLGANVASFLPPDQAAAVLALGMVAFLSAMTQTPITSFVIVMEMTANHHMLLPLMATSVIAHAFSRTVSPVPLYQALSYTLLRNTQEIVRKENLERQRQKAEATAVIDATEKALSGHETSAPAVPDAHPGEVTAHPAPPAPEAAAQDPPEARKKPPRRRRKPPDP